MRSVCGKQLHSLSLESLRTANTQHRSFFTLQTTNRWLYNTTTTSVIAITIGSSCIVGLSLLLSLVRTVERGMLMGACGSECGACLASGLSVLIF